MFRSSEDRGRCSEEGIPLNTKGERGANVREGHPKQCLLFRMFS